MLQLQLFLIRAFIGLNFIHHFAEKFGWLGQNALTKTTSYFASIGFSPTMVFIAGVCEFMACIGLTLGLFTRFTAVCTTIYLIVALIAGNHHTMGFIWANPGGGWEFPLFWAAMCLCFVINGGGTLSLDKILITKLPKKLQFLCV